MKILSAVFSIFILLMAFCMTSCASTSEVSSNGKPDFPEASIVHTDIEGKWELIKFEKAGKNIELVPDTEPDIIGINFGTPVDDLYPVNGFLGVNLFFNCSASADEKKRRKDEDLAGMGFSLGDYATTYRTGPAEHLAFESVFKECLFSSDSYEIKENNTLILYGSKKDTILTFNRMEKKDK